MAGANMSRNESLAGQSVKQGGYTVTYDKNGYAKKAVKDGGASATSSKKTTHANDSAAHNEAYEAAKRGDWDAVGIAVNKIGMSGGTYSDGSYDMRDANSYMQELQDEFGYNARDYYNKKYDDAYGAGSSDVYDATNGAVKTAAQWAEQTGGKPLPSNSASRNPGTTQANAGVSNAYDQSGMRDYLNQWYQNAQQQQQSAIDYATNQGILDLRRAQQDAEAQFQTQRNQIAIDEAKAKDNQALYAEARGDKGGIGAAQYDAIMNTAAQNRLAVNSAQTKLATDTSRQIADLRAQGEYEKADALLTLSQQYLSQLMSLEQWAAEYNLSVAQFNASLQQWQAEFDLKVADLLGSYNGQQTLSAKQFAFNQQQYQDSLKADQEKKLASAGEILLAAGIMPSASQLAAMGMTETDAQSYITAQKVAAAAKGNGSGSGGGTKKMTKTTAEDMAEAGQFTDAVVNWFRQNNYTDKYLKETYGWNGVTLEEQRQQNIDIANAGTIKNDFDQMMRAITAQLASGKDDAFEVAKRNAELMMPGLSEAAQQAVLDVFARYGRPLKIVTD